MEESVYLVMEEVRRGGRIIDLSSPMSTSMQTTRIMLFWCFTFQTSSTDLSTGGIRISNGELADKLGIN